MKAVNGNYLVQEESNSLKSGGIYVATSSDSEFVKCKVIFCPDDCNVKKSFLKESDSVTAVYAFKSNMRRVTLENMECYVLNNKDIVLME